MTTEVRTAFLKMRPTYDGPTYQEVNGYSIMERWGDHFIRFVIGTEEIFFRTRDIAEMSTQKGKL